MAPNHEINLVHDTVMSALYMAFLTHEELGDRGLQEAQENQFNEKALVGDIGCEKAALSFLQHKNFPICVFAEEHGKFHVVSDPSYTGFLDGIDGTIVYRREQRKGRHATLFAIYEGTDPVFGDWLAGGAMEHGTRQMFLGARTVAPYILNVESEVKTGSLLTSSCCELDTKTRIDFHNYTPREKLLCAKFKKQFPQVRPDTSCSSINFTDLLLGDMDVLIASPKKLQLEPKVFYGLLIGAGGVIMNEHGGDISDELCSQYGNKSDDGPMLIYAANRELAEQVRQVIITL